MHPDVRVPNLQEPPERLLRAGARVLRGPFDEVGRLTTALADPEGDELCLLVPPMIKRIGVMFRAPRARATRYAGGGE
jgi:hypothetical protein